MEIFMIIVLWGLFGAFSKWIKNKTRGTERSASAPEQPPEEAERIPLAVQEKLRRELDERFGDPFAARQAAPKPSPEGMDPCHDKMFKRPERILPIAPEAAPQPAWKPDFSREGLLQAVVMQEVLTRPSQRKRRSLH